MLDLKALEDQRAELTAKGHDLVKKIMSETAKLSAEEKEAYYTSTHCWDDEKVIRAQLSDVKRKIESARQYQEEERQEITRVFDREEKNRPVANNEFRNFGELLQGIAIRAGGSPISAQFGHQKSEELLYKLNHYQAAVSGMSVGTPSDGGYLVRKAWSDQFFTKGMEQSVLLPRCTPVTVGADFDSLEYPYIDESSRVTGSRWGGVQVFWVEEAGTVLAKKPKIGKGELRLEEMMGLAPVTNRLLRDASALQSVLTTAFQSEIAFKIDDSIMRGSGAGQMLGVLNSPALVSVTREGDDVDTVLSMYSRLPSRLEAGSIWLHHKNWIKKLPKMKIGDTPVWLPPGGLANRPVSTVLGSPAMSLEQCSPVGTVGDLLLVNMGEYVVIQKENEGTQFDESIHVRFEYNEMMFRWIKRINGQPVTRTAITPYQGTDTLSPFITVAA